MNSKRTVLLAAYEIYITRKVGTSSTYECCVQWQNG